MPVVFVVEEPVYAELTDVVPDVIVGMFQNIMHLMILVSFMNMILHLKYFHSS